MQRIAIWSVALTILVEITASTASGALVETLAGNGRPGRPAPSTTRTAARLNNPYGLVRGPDKAIYVCEVGNHVIRHIDTNGTTTIVAGIGKPGYAGDGGPATAASISPIQKVIPSA